jgi:hypothetical protein
VTPAARAVASAAAAAALLAGCAWGPGTRIKEPVVAGDELSLLVTGNTFDAVTESGAHIVLYFLPDGAVVMRGVRRDGTPFVDRGRWSVEDDRLCTRYEVVRGRQKTCEWVTAVQGTVKTYSPMGHPTARGRLERGVPPAIEGLPATPPQRG